MTPAQEIWQLLEAVVRAELALMLALLLAWVVSRWLLGPRGMRRATDACPNCGWRRVAASQVCPACRLAPEDSRYALPVPRERMNG